MNKRRTLICLFKNDDNKTFCIRNRNTDSFGVEFKRDYETICTDEITIIESVIRLNKLYGSESFQVIDIVSAENKYNRDQKEINSMKSFEINQYQNKGYVWDDTLDEFINPIYNDNEENRKIKEAIINYRNLSTLYEEKYNELSKKLCNIINEYEKKFEVELNKYNESINDLEFKYRTKKNELDNEYNNLLIDLSISKDELSTTKKQYQIYLESYNEYKNKSDELSKYLDDISKGKERLVNEYDSIKEKYDKLIEDKKNEINELENRISSLNDEVSYFENRSTEIQADIKEYVNSTLSYNQLYEKLDTLIRMIKKNESYYNSLVPNYEIEYLVKLGLQRDVIVNKITENQLKIG